MQVASDKGIDMFQFNPSLKVILTFPKFLEIRGGMGKGIS